MILNLLKKMHNIKDIRKDFENFKDKLKNRNVDISLDNIISLDEENRKLIQEKEKFEMEKKTISKSKDQSLFEKSKELSLKIEEINKNQIKLQTQITDILSSIPVTNLSSFGEFCATVTISLKFPLQCKAKLHPAKKDFFTLTSSLSFKAFIERSSVKIRFLNFILFLIKLIIFFE